MLAVGLIEAKKFSSSPMLIARDIHNEKKHLYWVEDSALPCQNCKDNNPLKMLDAKRIWQLRKKYKISARVLRKIEACYSNPKSEDIDLGKDGQSLNCRLFLGDIEDDIIRTLKTEIRLDKNTEYIPFYDEDEIRNTNMHSTFQGPSGAGKTTIAAKVILYNFPDTKAWIFGPLVSKSKIWKELQHDRGKKKTLLIDSGKVQVPIALEEVTQSRTSLLCLDDPDAMEPRSRHILQNLCSEGLFHGRHLGLTCFSIQHDSFSRKLGSTKAQSVESTRIFCFPNISRHVTTKMLKNRLGMNAKLIQSIYKFIVSSDRWLMIKLDHPVLCLTATGCKLLS